jgi:hypothetical protein
MPATVTRNIPRGWQLLCVRKSEQGFHKTA